MNKPSQFSRYCASGAVDEIPTLRNGQVMEEWWRSTTPGERGKRLCRVRCFCGSVRVTQWPAAIKSQSCGCMTKQILREARTVHGHSKQGGKNGSRTFKSWKSMLDRCYLEAHKSYKDYAGRGITVCDEWREFAAFLADMGEHPVGKQLGRINNDGNYEPGNCRWETPVENCNNRRSSRFITIGGETKTLQQWCREKGIDFHVVWHRLDAVWSEYDALNRPLRIIKARMAEHRPPQ